MSHQKYVSGLSRSNVCTESCTSRSKSRGFASSICGIVSFMFIGATLVKHCSIALLQRIAETMELAVGSWLESDPAGNDHLLHLRQLKSQIVPINIVPQLIIAFTCIFTQNVYCIRDVWSRTNHEVHKATNCTFYWS